MARSLVVAAVVLASTALAAAQPRRPPRRPPAPRPPVTFAAPVAYQACETSWAFACGIPTGDGGHYGTARPMQHCRRYAFAPDGTVTRTSGFEVTIGRYRLDGRTVHLTFTTDDGAVEHDDPTLSADGATLADLTRVP